MPPEKPWTIESMLRLGLWIFGGMVAGMAGNSALAGPGDSTGATSFARIAISSSSLYVAAFLGVQMFLREQELSWGRAFGFGSPQRARALVLAVGVTVVALPVAWSLAEFSGLAIQYFGTEPAQQTAVKAMRTSEGLVPQIGLAVIAILLAPPIEEVLFRGILYPFVKQCGFPRLAVWGTALVFSASHGNLLTFLPLVLLGVALAWLYERTGNLLAPILTHSLFNLANWLWLMMARA